MKTTTVSWYNCDCEYRSDYCAEYHTTWARIPTDVLNQYIQYSVQ